MHTFILQDWTTIRGGVTTVVQGESNWLDLTPYQDVIFWVDVREVSTTAPTLTLQTAPTKDETLFMPMVAAFALTAAAAPTVKTALMTSGTTINPPLARFLRWQLNGTPPWDTTFRILVAANSPGT